MEVKTLGINILNNSVLILLLYVEFACSLRVCVGSLQALWLRPTLKKNMHETNLTMAVGSLMRPSDKQPSQQRG